MKHWHVLSWQTCADISAMNSYSWTPGQNYSWISICWTRGSKSKRVNLKNESLKTTFFSPFFYLREARLLKGPLSLSAYLKLQYGNLLSFEIQIPQRSHRKRLYFLFCLIFELPEFLVDCIFSSGRLARPAGDSGKSRTFSGTLGFWISAIFVSFGI